MRKLGRTLAPLAMGLVACACVEMGSADVAAPEVEAAVNLPEANDAPAYEAAPTQTMDFAEPAPAAPAPDRVTEYRALPDFVAHGIWTEVVIESTCPEWQPGDGGTTVATAIHQDGNLVLQVPHFPVLTGALNPQDQAQIGGYQEFMEWDVQWACTVGGRARLTSISVQGEVTEQLDAAEENASCHTVAEYVLTFNEPVVD